MRAHEQRNRDEDHPRPPRPPADRDGRSPRLPAGTLTSLQRSAGNAAVAEVMQRRMHAIEPGPATEPDTQLFAKFFKAVDDAVEWAYEYITTIPGLGALKDDDGHTRRWVESWEKFALQGRPGGIAMLFGYAVESLTATRLNGAGNPGLPAAVSFSSQVTIGSTRPDYVLYLRGNVIGAVDITAAGSAGHVLDKRAWHSLFPRFGESLYPSLTSDKTDEMKALKDNTGNLTAEEVAQLKQQAQADRAELQRQWQQLKNHFIETMTTEKFMKAGKVKPGGDQVVYGPARRKAVIDWMVANLLSDNLTAGTAAAITSTAEKNAASMLNHFQKGWATTFGFDGSSVSESGAEAFLTSVLPGWRQAHGDNDMTRSDA